MDVTQQKILGVSWKKCKIELISSMVNGGAGER